jgi:SAM-dependent methyltransferase
MAFANVYKDSRRAGAYDKLEFPGTYYLAFRDLPEIIREHVKGKQALDFGCGTGRSTRFLKRLGFDTRGVDIAPEMLELARARDPEGDYHLVDERGLDHLKLLAFDLVLSAFTFDNIPTMEKKVALFRGLAERLRPDGKIINLVSSPDIYTHDWASFKCTQFAENFTAGVGDYVYTMMLDVDDHRPVQDILWPDEAYREVYARAGLQVIEMRQPLANVSEPYAWVNETTIAPWVIYVLGEVPR